MTAAKGEIIRIDNWRSPVWADFVPSRTGWQAICSVHGDLGRGWAYGTHGIAQSVLTKHLRSRRWHGES